MVSPLRSPLTVDDTGPFGSGGRRLSPFAAMWRVWGTLWRYAPGGVATLLGLAFALTATSGVGLLLLVPLLGLAGVDVGQGAVQDVAVAVGVVLGAWGVPMTLPVVLLAYVFVVAATSGLDRLHTLRSTALNTSFVAHLRWRMHGAILHAEWTFLVRYKTASFHNALTQEIERAGAAAFAGINLIVKLVLMALYLALALFVSTWTTLLVLGCGALLALALNGKTRQGRSRGEVVAEAYESLYGAVAEDLAGLRVIKSHGAEERPMARFADRSAGTAAAIVGSTQNHADLAFWLQIGSAATMAVVFFVALEVVGLPLASILLLLYLFARLVPMITGVQRQVNLALSLLPAFDRALVAIESCEAAAEGAAGGSAVGDLARVDVSMPPRLRRAVRFEGVSFAHGSGDLVIVDVDLEIVAGQTTAIVGASGAGKSTIADLVVGLVRPTHGRVWLDDAPLDGDLARAWRRGIGYVNQDTFLFHESIRENLRVVRPEASDEEMHDALRAAAAGFVLDLPQGLDTIVGDRGVRLSGGERQRVALARAILRRPTLLILDEATSALDAENERLIQDAIERMGGRHTLLVIAHRLATVRSADVIHVLDRGRLVESGGWDELVRRPDGRLRALCLAQGLDIVVPPTVAGLARTTN
jgi:ATP-binding cassette, subfamily C, bacterial